MNIRIFLFSFFITITVFTSFSCDDADEPIIVSGDIDISVVEDRMSGPIVVTITNTDDIDAIEADPKNTILYIGGVDKDELSYKFDLSDTNLKENDKIYLFAFIDNDYKDGVPSINLGDFVGFYTNEETMSASHTLDNGRNYNLDIKISRIVTDFEAKIYYAIDKGESTYSAGTGKTQEIVMAVHEGGVKISMTSGGGMKIDIDPDYIMAIEKFVPPVFDHLTGTRPDPAPERVLDVLPAIYAGLSVTGDTIVGDIYLFSIIDYDANGKLDTNDDAGYFGEVRADPIVIPGVGTIAGGSFYPKAFPLSKGDNRDGTGAFWINFDYPEVTPETP